MNIAIDSNEEGQSSISLWTDVSPFMLSIQEMEEQVDDVKIVLNEVGDNSHEEGKSSILLWTDVNPFNTLQMEGQHGE